MLCLPAFARMKTSARMMHRSGAKLLADIKNPSMPARFLTFGLNPALFSENKRREFSRLQRIGFGDSDFWEVTKPDEKTR